MSSSTAICARGVVKRYGTHIALRGVDFDVMCGEVFGFIGPNGAGKTTTIRILLDLVRPTAGRVRVLGCDPRRSGAAVRDRIGYLPGDLHLYDDLTAGRTFDFIERLRGSKAIDREAIVERLEIELHRPIRTLSKGNRQKVGLTLALMHRPELLLLDEPTSGLDPVAQREVHCMVDEARGRGQTVFLSSHVLSEVERLSDRVGLIRDGRLAAIGDVSTLKARARRQLELQFAAPTDRDAFAHVAGVADVAWSGQRATFTLSGSVDALLKAAAQFEVVNVVSHEPDLEDLFLEVVGDEVSVA